MATLSDTEHSSTHSTAIDPKHEVLYTSNKTPILLDSEDYSILANSLDKHKLSVTTGGYVVLDKQVILSRLLLGILDQPSLIVKYLNNNKLDLRRENLRVSTRKEHCREEVLPHAPEVKKVQGVHKVNRSTWVVADGYGKGGILKYKKFQSFEEAKGYVAKATEVGSEAST